MNEERGGTNLCFFQVKKKNRRRRPERERVLKFFQEPSTSLFVESTSIICGEYSHGMLHFTFQTLYLGVYYHFLAIPFCLRLHQVLIITQTKIILPLLRRR